MPGASPSDNSANHCSKKKRTGTKKMQDKAIVYVKLKLLGKEVPCLVDTGSKVTLVPSDLIKRFILCPSNLYSFSSRCTFQRYYNVLHESI